MRVKVEKLPSDRVIHVLEHLEIDDYVKVKWFDANGFRNYPLTQLPKIAYLPVETMGRFGGLHTDGRLLTIINEKAGEKGDGVNIPIGCIEAIKLIQPGGARFRKKRLVGEEPPLRLLERTIYVGA